MPYADTHGSSSLLFAAAIDRSVFKHLHMYVAEIKGLGHFWTFSEKNIALI